MSLKNEVTEIPANTFAAISFDLTEINYLTAAGFVINTVQSFSIELFRTRTIMVYS